VLILIIFKFEVVVMTAGAKSSWLLFKVSRRKKHGGRVKKSFYTHTLLFDFY
jgi:hypothetical protein